MLQKSCGIVLHTVKYSDTSIIVKLYSEHFGIQSFLVRSVRSSKAKVKAGLFQPLCLIDFVFYHKEKGGLQSFKEVQSAYVFRSLPYDIRKSAVAVFMAEVLFRSLKEESASPSLFGFLRGSIELLDRAEHSLHAFHLHFMVRLAEHLGFLPEETAISENDIFDLEEGIFISTSPKHMNYLDKSLTPSFRFMIRHELREVEQLKIGSLKRDELLDKLLDFFRLHLPSFGKLHSLPVLRQVFSQHAG